MDDAGDDEQKAQPYVEQRLEWLPRDQYSDWWQKNCQQIEQWWFPLSIRVVAESVLAIERAQLRPEKIPVNPHSVIALSYLAIVVRIDLDTYCHTIIAVLI